MNAKQIEISSKNGNSKGGWLVGGVLMMAAALAITLLIGILTNGSINGSNLCPNRFLKFGSVPLKS